MTAAHAANPRAATSQGRHLFAWLLTGLAVLVVAFGLAFHLAFPEAGHGGTIGGPFELTDNHGRPVTEKSWPGRYLLVYFGYTHCPDACPTTLAAIADALDRLGPLSARVQPLFISVDPRRDTPSALASYVAAFSPRLVGLTGSDQQVAYVAREYGAFFSDFAERRAADYSIDHGHDIYLMAPDGHFLSEITSSADPAAIAAELRRELRPS